MGDSALFRNSSLFVAYMGCLGWGSAYFYGWGASFYYGFPWWVVGAGVDDIARSLFYAVTVIVIFLIGWGVGVIFFLSIKKKNNVHDLSFVRLFLATLLLFVPPAMEFSVIHKRLIPEALAICVIAAIFITLIIRLFGRLVSFRCISEIHFIHNHRVEFLMTGFMAYFWLFSLFAGWYKPQFKKEYQTLYHDNAWYYVLARYDNRLVLSGAYRGDGTKFIILDIGQMAYFDISEVSVR
ncbi:hypothetical protein [Enterobacter cloacae]|uniref:hypothetical protein n=1 Tax=Enterobacter cloacae TaxID=550 RepID=UPI000B8DA993|nr:hypothetical protein [Enterobacter cloacae]ASQ17369.1 hypothetical protein BJM06_01570 [Enterobacter cloacae]